MSGMEQQIAFNVDGLYVRLHGPYPQAVIDAADNLMHFQDRETLLRWLRFEWPRWRNNIVRSENLL
jgi:hypothetical protein